MSDDTYESYEPVSICPAQGWRAVYIHYGEDDKGPGWTADPLIGWVIYRVSDRRIGEGDTEVRNHGSEIHGEVLDGSSTWRATEVSNFWRYLGPGEPDPTPGQVAAEAAKRAAAEAAWSERPATVVSASYGRSYGKWCWALTVRPDKWDGTAQAELPVLNGDPATAGRTFRQLRALGIPVGPRYGDPEGTEPFWRQGWDEHRVAQEMAGRQVTIGRRGRYPATPGPWQVVPAPPPPEVAAST